MKKHKASKSNDKGYDVSKIKEELAKTKQTMVNLQSKLGSVKEDDDGEEEQDQSFCFVNVGRAPAIDKLVAHVHHNKGQP